MTTELIAGGVVLLLFAAHVMWRFGHFAATNDEIELQESDLEEVS